MGKISDKHRIEDYVPPEAWGKDHFSTLAYAETVMVEFGFFEVGNDCRMRQNRRHTRVLAGSKPKRAAGPKINVAMDPKYGSILKDGTYIPSHDDWNCIQDLAAGGILKAKGKKADQGPEIVEPKTKLILTDLGARLVNDIRRHKRENGSFGHYAIDTEIKSRIDAAFAPYRLETLSPEAAKEAELASSKTIRP
ncbi:MAG: hypothetical protein ING19_12900 [Azospirillum sp.]|nr:hypothetical protein [Azospirillum sp.]